MGASDTLLQLIAHLQRGVEVAHGRRTLLEYARRSSGARLALLFLLDEERQVLKLLEYCGRQPRHSSSRNSGEIFDPNHIPLDGVFSSALGTAGLVHISNIHTDLRSLKGERYWTWPGGHVVLGAVGQGTQQPGMLVLCFSTQEGWQASSLQTTAGTGNLLICVTLLSVYLTNTNKASCSVRTTEQQAAIDQERIRIARDIHDGPAQFIAHVLHKLEYIERILEKEPQAALREIERARQLLEESLKELRYRITSLIPVQLEEQGFDAALQGLLDEYAINEPTLKIFYDSEYSALVPPSLEVPTFRLIQEALNNVRKHAQATRVAIRIRLLNGLFVVEVSDNGMGFDVERILHSADAAQHIGLRAMRDRVQQAGGMWTISSKPGEGTTVKARFPLTKPSNLLTNREREVLQLLIEGSTNRAIAEKLSVSIETIKSHVHHIMQKMQARDRTQVAVMATKQRWI